MGGGRKMVSLSDAKLFERCVCDAKRIACKYRVVGNTDEVTRAEWDLALVLFVRRLEK